MILFEPPLIYLCGCVVFGLVFGVGLIKRLGFCFFQRDLLPRLRACPVVGYVRGEGGLARGVKTRP